MSHTQSGEMKPLHTQTYHLYSTNHTEESAANKTYAKVPLYVHTVRADTVEVVEWSSAV